MWAVVLSSEKELLEKGMSVCWLVHGNNHQCLLEHLSENQRSQNSSLDPHNRFPVDISKKN